MQKYSFAFPSRGVRNWRKRPALVRRGCIPTHRVNALWCRNEPVYTRHVVHKQQGIACEYFTGYTRSMAKRKVSKTPEIRDIPVVILCGGRGTRLKEETEFIPKPMVRIGDRPILWHIMKIYYAQGFRRFILPLGYKGEKIREYINSYQLYANDFTLKHGGSKTSLTYHGRPAERWQISCIDTGLDTQTGGRIKKLEKFIKSPLFMLTYGDGVANVDLGKLLSEHTKQKSIVTMTAVHPPVRFGEVILKKDGTVQGFSEKPHYAESGMNETLINGGFFAIDSKIFKRMSEDDALVFEKDVLTQLAKDNELAAVPHHGFWQCMDTIRDTEVLNDAWKRGAAPWKLWR